MPRRARIVHANWPHHVCLRGNNRRRLCSYPNDYKKLLAFVAEAARRYSCAIHEVCVMSNHIHLIVTPRDALALAAFVKRFAQRYAQYRNRKRDGSGKLYEERFWSEPILSDEALAGHTAYVALNPVVAGVVRTPGEYKWSSYAHYAQERGSTVPAAMMTPSSWYLGLAGDADTRAREYRDSVARALASGRKPDRLPREPLPSGKRLERPNRKRAA